MSILHNTYISKYLLTESICIFFSKISDQGWNGYEDQNKVQWTFSGSLLYSIACITTIGYGDQTPKTQNGKFVTIWYSVIGVPLMIICSRNNGVAMANCFRFIYWKCYDCCWGSKNLQRHGLKPFESIF